MVNSGVMRHRVLGIKNSDKYVILSSTNGKILTCLDGFKEPINCFARTIFVPLVVTTETDLPHVRNFGCCRRV